MIQRQLNNFRQTIHGDAAGVMNGGAVDLNTSGDHMVIA